MVVEFCLFFFFLKALNFGGNFQQLDRFLSFFYFLKPLQTVVCDVRRGKEPPPKNTKRKSTPENPGSGAMEKTRSIIRWPLEVLSQRCYQPGKAGEYG